MIELTEHPRASVRGAEEERSPVTSDALKSIPVAAHDCCFEKLALPCLDAVSRFARALTRNHDDADDLVQDTFMQAFRGWHTFQPTADPRRWLFAICHHVFLRNRQRLLRLPIEHGDPDALASMMMHHQSVLDGTDQILNKIILGGALKVAIGALEEMFRVVVLLVDGEGYSYQEAAELLCIPVGTVRSRLFRGRRCLQEALMVHAHDLGLVNNAKHV